MRDNWDLSHLAPAANRNRELMWDANTWRVVAKSDHKPFEPQDDKMTWRDGLIVLMVFLLPAIAGGIGR